MTDKPEIKVGQRWVTRGGGTLLPWMVRVLAADAKGPHPIIVEDCSTYAISTRNADGSQFDDDEYESPGDLISLAPSTVKREVALYWSGHNSEVKYVAEGPASMADRRISEPLTIEFTLLPGESADA